MPRDHLVLEPPPTPPLPTRQGCLTELDIYSAQANEAQAIPLLAADPPAPPLPLRLVASLLEGGLLLACPSLLHQGGGAGSWFGYWLLDGSLPPDPCYLLATARLCSALGSEGRARLAPHVLAAAPLMLWGMAGRAHPVSCCAPIWAGCGWAPHANPLWCSADASWALCALLRPLHCKL